MSQENVDVVRRALQAFADGGPDAMAEFWDADIDWRAAEGAIDDVGEMHGPVAVRRYIQDWLDTFDDFSVVVEELRDVGDDRVLSIQRLKGRARLSRTETDLRFAVVSTVRDGKVVRGREYLSVEDALEAAGLREEAMSQENVEIVRRGWDAWIRGDLPGVFREYDPEVVWDMSHVRDSPESEYRGSEGVKRFFNDWLAIADDYEVGVDEILAAPDGRVVTLYWQRARGRRSGLAMEQEVAHVATVRDGKITYIEIYTDRDEALEAAGLR